MHNLERATKVGRQQAFDQPLALITHRPAAFGPHNIGGLGRVRALAEKETDRQIEKSRHGADVGKRRFGLATLNLREPANRTVKPRGKIVQRPVA